MKIHWGVSKDRFGNVNDLRLRGTNGLVSTRTSKDTLEKVKTLHGWEQQVTGLYGISFGLVFIGVMINGGKSGNWTQEIK